METITYYIIQVQNIKGDEDSWIDWEFCLSPQKLFDSLEICNTTVPKKNWRAIERTAKGKIITKSDYNI